MEGSTASRISCSCLPMNIAHQRTFPQSTPSMRRPIPVKSVFALSTLLAFSRSAKPPLSPPFHPHSYVSDFRSVPVGCSRFSRCCYLISVLGFPPYEGSLGQELVAVT